MSMYGDYIAERLGDSIIETDEGFATYRYMNNGKSCYIADIYVKPEYRKSGTAASLADRITAAAIEQGCTELLGSVVPFANNSTASLAVLIAYGMSIQSSSPELIVFRKDIGQFSLKEGSRQRPVTTRSV